ncbi:hypothetical protein JXQ31_12465 [candidate division KSB1 bacterium]|nr:hypothetical protein [candidate division KSB1 bacterium]
MLYRPAGPRVVPLLFVGRTEGTLLANITDFFVPAHVSIHSSRTAKRYGTRYSTTGPVEVKDI